MTVNRAGRIRIAVALLVAAAAPVGLLLNARAGAMAETQLAAAAVAQALAALPRDVDVVSEHSVAAASGHAATAEQQHELAAVVSRFRDLIRERKFDEAWELTDSATRGQWTEGDWTKEQGVILDKIIPEGEGEMGMPGAIPLLMSGAQLSVAGVRVAGDEGVARLAVAVDFPVTVALQRSSGAWLVDLARTDELAARDAVASQVDNNAGSNAGDRLWLMVMASEGAPFARNALDLVTAPGPDMARTCEAATVEGDRAQVGLRVRGTVYMDMGIERAGATWKLDWEGPVRLATRDAPMDLVAGTGEVGSGPKQAACMSNQKQLALAVMMYCQDYDEKMPIADRWCDATLPYCKNEAIYTCPADGEPWSYAMNYKLSRQEMGAAMSPAETVLLFEAEPSRKNAYDEGGAQPGQSMALPPRHGAFNNFAWTDGHVTSQRPEDLAPEHYRLSGSKPPLGGAARAVPAPAEAVEQAP